MFSRRIFLQGAGAAATLMCVPRRSFAQAQGPLLVTIEAEGGWDPTILMDPKVGPAFQPFFDESQILDVAGIRFAPFEGATPYQVGADGAVEGFLDRYAQQLLVINGIDTQTNSHDVGPRHTFSGTVRTDFPALTALYAASMETRVGKLPIPYLTSGGFSATQGLLPTTRTGGIDSFLSAAQPNSSYGDQTYLPTQTLEQVRSAEQLRQERRRGRRMLPKLRRDLEKHFSARQVEAGFEPVIQTLNGIAAYTPREQERASELDKAKLVVGAMASGICAAANIHLGGFDTHDGAHNDQHRERIDALLNLIDYFWRTANAAGIADRITMLVGSDFSRTTYNSDGGKDHWPITSMMMMGNGVSGGRVVGQTRDNVLPDGTLVDGHLANKIKVQGGEVVVVADDDPDGFIMTPAHIHQSLRAQLGIASDPLSNRFALENVPAQPLPLLR